MNDENPPLQIEIDDGVARGIYTNLALLTHSETEFILDFLFIQPQTPKTKVLTRLVTSPVHAKRLMTALADNIAKYEARFGTIAAAEPSAPPRPGVYQ
ncbi:MAG: hypothetical protein A2506_00760 [Elusimicrobia bacterium RIFOXYD12_FULL_66_9]|nr:MAG: hypothetical protein A2506_00760 [Elusimicrobia bacterium RIFOXYD12_FULL_66_9]